MAGGGAIMKEKNNIANKPKQRQRGRRTQKKGQGETWKPKVKKEHCGLPS